MSTGHLVINTEHLTKNKEVELHVFRRALTVRQEIRVIVYGPNRCVADFALSKQNLLDMLALLEEDTE